MASVDREATVAFLENRRWRLPKPDAGRQMKLRLLQLRAVQLVVDFFCQFSRLRVFDLVSIPIRTFALPLPFLCALCVLCASVLGVITRTKDGFGRPVPAELKWRSCASGCPKPSGLSINKQKGGVQ